MISLQRFITAQREDYASALTEVKTGRKRTHWMWYIFPQLAGLGQSETAKYYALTGWGEAQAFLKHPILGERIREITAALLELPGNDAYKVFGTPDDLKLRSSMTLFAAIEPDSVFQDVLDRYFEGKPDQRTLDLLDRHSGHK